MKDLQESRKEIDSIDSEIVSLFERRMEVCKDVAEYKLRTGKAVLDRQRELDKIKTLKNKASSDFYAHGVEELFEQIMAMSRKMQYKLLTEEGVNNDIGFDIVDKIPMDGAKVVYQGIPGAYSQQAATEYFGDKAEYLNVTTFREAMKYVRDGKADYAVLPMENSSAGIVTDVYDLLVEFSNYIVDTFDVKIEHCLCGLKGSRIEDIHEVYSHPQALAQCSDMISSHNWKSIQHSNTAVAAKMLAKMDKENGVTDAAAICSTIAANMYGLDILQEDIQNNNQNRTRFAALSKEMIIPKNAEKISLCFSLPHTTGSLYSVLARFAMTGLNLTKIESRPLKEGNNGEFKYNFYLDFTGNVHHCDTLDLLCSLSQELPNFSFLGNYVEYDPNDEH